MKRILQTISYLALALTLLPAVSFFEDKIELSEAKLWMLVAALGWFMTAPFWMEHKATD